MDENKTLETMGTEEVVCIDDYTPEMKSSFSKGEAGLIAAAIAGIATAGVVICKNCKAKKEDKPKKNKKRLRLVWVEDKTVDEETVEEETIVEESGKDIE